jgi:uncharacterized protein YkwD
MPVPATGRRPRRIIARTLVFGASALLAAGLLTWSPSSTTGWNQGSAEATLWQLLNGARTNNGLAPVQQHGTLVAIARGRSADMLNRDYFSHTIPGCGCLVYAQYDANGVAWAWAGENIGWNSGLDDAYSPVRVHEAFMASAGHRANVLDGRFTHAGVGAAAADGKMFQGHVQNTRMYTELFLQAPGGTAPAPAAPPSGGGSGGGGGYTQPAAPVAQAPAPKAEPKPKEMTVASPRRPTSTAGIDGVATIVAAGPSIDVTARLAADDALGIPRPEAMVAAAKAPPTAMTPGMQVTAAAPAEAGLFDGIVGTLLGFLFG